MLNEREWGPADAPLVVCLHGVGRTGGLFRRLAEETLPHFHIRALDLRGHGESPWEPPWRIEQHVADVVGAVGELEPAAWIGHSFGGRLIVELAARGLVERAVLLDPAIRMRPDLALREAELHRLRDDASYSQSAAAAMLGELAGPHARVEALTMPTLLVVPRDEAVVGARQLAYAQRACPRLVVASVGGGHHVLEDAFEETAALVREFLSSVGISTTIEPPATTERGAR